MSTWSLRFWERCRVIEVFAFFTDSSAATVSVTKNVFRVRESRFPSGPVEFFCANDANLLSVFPVAGAEAINPERRVIHPRCFGANVSDDVCDTCL